MMKGIIFLFFNFDGNGTIADWVGIIATVLTIIFTLRFYNKDNKNEFRTLLYTRRKKIMNENGTQSITNEIEYVFCAVNLSKFQDSVYFYGIFLKESMLQETMRKLKLKTKPRKKLDNDFLRELIENSDPNYELVEPRSQSSLRVVTDSVMDSYALYGYKLSKKAPTLLICYVNIVGKEFCKQIIYSKQDMIKLTSEKTTSK